MKISKDLYMKICTKTMTDYSGIVLNEDMFYVENEDVLAMIQDLICEIGSLEEQIEDLDTNRRIMQEEDFYDAYKDQCLEEELK